jgi:hypothetical protein
MKTRSQQILFVLAIATCVREVRCATAGPRRLENESATGFLARTCF